MIENYIIKGLMNNTFNRDGICLQYSCCQGLKISTLGRLNHSLCLYSINIWNPCIWLKLDIYIGKF